MVKRVREIEQDANDIEAQLPQRPSETTKHQHTGLDNDDMPSSTPLKTSNLSPDGALSTPHPSLLLSLPPEIRLQIWRAATYAPSLLRAIPPYNNSNQRAIPPYNSNAPSAPSVFLIPLPLSCLNTSCYDRHEPSPSTPPSHNTRAWLLTSRQIYAEARPLLDAHPPSLHVCYAHPLKRYLALALPSPPADFSLPTLQKLRSLSFCLRLGITTSSAGGSALGGGYALAMSPETGWEGGHGGTGCVLGCMFCARVRDMPRDLGACFPELREVRLSLSFMCMGREAEGKSMKGRILRNRLVGGEQEGIGGFMDDDERVEWVAVEMCKQLPLWGFVGKRLEGVEVKFKRGIVHDVRNLPPNPVDGSVGVLEERWMRRMR